MTAHPPDRKKALFTSPSEFIFQTEIKPEELTVPAEEFALLSDTASKREYILTGRQEIIKNELKLRNVQFRIEEGDIIIEDINRRSILGDIVAALANKLVVKNSTSG